ncbi:flagellar hook-associated protein FlgK [Parasedimentitalea huanghaiensis]|uniref:Flagellar hook-associated protein 1 n=1 Tax=Parasedimentitalea huanghaiensis TaxID=2682100 RepID=A0A6L6WQQ6_9RHOB|nr:flagellar hook-associated protein FlgK [Zongyanglinia huanghaiensis]MVO17882.1 flagellar hook-associated protein FlgK [Zongyanglinia huanghaiensis]
MSITTALSTAMTGLTAAGRASSVVSENIANSLTPGYAQRSLVLSSGAATPGVRVEGIQRNVDPAVQAGRRVAEAEHDNIKAQADFYTRLSGLVGSVDDPFSITSRLSNFDGSLIEAISRPDSMPRLNDLSLQAEALADTISTAAEGLRDLRTTAERTIDAQVDTVNQALKDVQKLNARIMVSQAGGMSTAAMLDQRGQLIDQINQIIPVNVVQRDNGQVALFSQGGAILLDGNPAELSFDGKPDTMPHMTQANGLLSGLEINGIAVETDPGGPLRGGSLAAQFELRDEISVEAQEDLDAMARDLIERFQDPAVDATLGATDPGLFTDSGAFFDPVNVIGISNRIVLNEKVSMDGDSETWRLRDGLNAAAPGNAGDARLLQSYTAALDATRSVTSPGLGTTTLNASTLSANLLSHFSQNTNAADQALSFASASFSEMSQMELAQGVDTDAELQNLMLIEQAFAANAKMMTVVDELMDTLLRI